MRTRPGLFRLMLLVSLLSACTAPPAPPAPDLPTSVTVVGTDFAFAPQTIEVPAGKPVTLTFRNDGEQVHDWQVPALQLHLAAGPKGTARETHVFDRPGEYPILCTLAGHADYGMVGVFRVVGADGAAPAVLSTEASPAPLPEGLTRLPQPALAPPVRRSAPERVKVSLEVRETAALVADGVATTLWTFGGTVPGPMIRVRQGDTVELTLKNAATNLNTHSVDFHAATGPGGGGHDTTVGPGGTATIAFQTLHPGAYVYHCATPKMATHLASGLYGLLVVEPPEGYAPVDRELYVMQGEYYLKGDRAQGGLRAIDWAGLLDERPTHVVMNGAVGQRGFEARTDERVRLFFGVGGPNQASSLHVVGEVFDTLYPQGAAEAVHHVQTTLVPPGGAAIAELAFDVPGTYPLVDHAMGRMEKGAMLPIVVSGSPKPEIYQAISKDTGGSHAHDGHSH